MSDHCALLLTDVVDSTALAAMIGDDAMSALWDAHDRTSRELLVSLARPRDRTHRRPVRALRARSRRRGLRLRLPRGADPVAGGAARACRHPLGSAVRIRPTARRSSSSTAPGRPMSTGWLPIAARVMSLALGGQTLLTDAARAELEDDASHAVVSHGHWHLRASTRRSSCSRSRRRVSRRSRRRTPRRSTAWSGAARSGSRCTTCATACPPSAARFSAANRCCRTWPCGSSPTTTPGSSRCSAPAAWARRGSPAQRFGWLWLGEFPGGVWFCDLSQSTTLDGIAQAVAQGPGPHARAGTIRSRPSGGRSPGAAGVC